MRRACMWICSRLEPAALFPSAYSWCGVRGARWWQSIFMMEKTKPTCCAAMRKGWPPVPGVYHVCTRMATGGGRLTESEESGCRCAASSFSPRAARRSLRVAAASIGTSSWNRCEESGYACVSSSRSIIEALQDARSAISATRPRRAAQFVVDLFLTHECSMHERWLLADRFA